MSLLQLLSENTGLPRFDLIRIIESAPRRYKVFHIPKRSGGNREIAQPAREVKMLQRVLLNTVLAELPIHAAAKAYRAGQSIVHNALPHAGDSPILKMDFKDFFPSIRSSDWIRYCEQRKLFDEPDRRLTALILFRRIKSERLMKLSIGAPTSPLVSNALLFTFDAQMSEEAERRNIVYTRYADDLTFSGQRIGMLRDMVAVTEKILRGLRSPRLTVNRDKTTFITTANRRTVTGITLANDGTIGLGRDKKRLVSAEVHRAANGRLEPEQLRRLCGYLAFVNVVEPEFLAWLRTKYGAEAIDKIRGYVIKGDRSYPPRKPRPI